jgi:hypothetical protein
LRLGQPGLVADGQDPGGFQRAVLGGDIGPVHARAGELGHEREADGEIALGLGGIRIEGRELARDVQALATVPQGARQIAAGGLDRAEPGQGDTDIALLLGRRGRIGGGDLAGCLHGFLVGLQRVGEIARGRLGGAN